MMSHWAAWARQRANERKLGDVVQPQHREHSEWRETGFTSIVIVDLYIQLYIN
jgi:hypothetical protein